MDPKKINILIAITVISFVMVFVQVNSFKRGDTNPVQQLTADTLMPAQGFLANLGRRFSGIWQSFTRASRLEEENKRLLAEIYALREESDLFNRTREENKNLRKLLDIAQLEEGRVIAAQVIGRDPDNWFQSVNLDKGYKQGVRKNMVAISSEGVVGRVISVSRFTSRMRLISSEKSAIPAQLVSTGELGVVYGEGKNICVMKYVNAEAKVEVGEQVITSRLSQVYPPGKTIGKVSKIYGRDQILYQAVQVKPSVQFGNLEYVLLIGRK
jgi:rod shape-determining protein MreC